MPPDLLQQLASQPGQETDAERNAPGLEANGSLLQALRTATSASHPDPALALIAEAKHASPSAGPLLHGDLASYLAAVRLGGACAISAVTAQGRFGGSFATLRAAHATGLPTLMKDFVTEIKQLDLARRHGASAVLIIEALHAPSVREALVRAAHDRGLEVLLEVHDDDQAQTAAASEADLLGVNSRDLRTLRVDLHAARGLVRSMVANDASRPVLLLSGTELPIHADQAQACGAAGILVGSALLRHPDPATLARALRRPLVKVCGNRTPQDIQAARDADLVGVVVGTDSRRDVDLATASQLLRLIERQGAAGVAVTRRTTGEQLAALARHLRPTYLQVHGDLRDEEVVRLHGLGVGVIHATAPGMTAARGADLTLLDATPEGGSGRPHGARVADGTGLHLVAGGLDAATVADRIASSGACGADASSALETDGRKDPGKVAAFIAAAHGARRDLHGA